jgi:hypothetical protein
MSPSEYQQLVEFLGKRFEHIDRRSSTSTGASSRSISASSPSIGASRRWTGGWAICGRTSASSGARCREILQRDLADLKQHVALLQSRIAEIEQRLTN